ncbi:MAG TPA: PAS domain S-box protein [Gemmatimonadaceae bacterium]|nr:PAS domain S-box protein [Gemmatimonadaceae bacterium]
MSEHDRPSMEALPPESLASYDAVFGELPVMVALLRHGRFVYLNRAGQEGLGATSREQWLGRDVELFSSEEEVPLVRERIAAVEGSHATAPLRHGRFRKIDGTLLDVEVMTLPVTIGGVEVAQCVATDVSQRAAAERAFAHAEEKFATAFRASPDGIVIVRARDRTILNANPAWCTLTGCDLATIEGRSLHDLGIVLKPDEQRELITRIERDGRVRDVALQYRREDSTEWRWAVVSVETFIVDGERSVLAITRDVTEDRLLQARLRQSQKMDAVGQLAGGIAHDFNNLLTVIRANTELVIDDLPSAEPVQDDLNSIIEACDRAATLTRQLLAFSRTQSLDIRPFDLNDALRTAGQMISRMLGPGIAFEWRLGDVPNVLADRGQVEQILMNLLVNARDAMPDGGVIELETARETVTPETFSEQVTGIAVVPGEYVRWTVTDHGHGMSPETRAHVFEPFFTTKQPGSGTGLGLATVYGIVKQSQGYIWIDSTLGVGTSVHVYLPVA